MRRTVIAAAVLAAGLPLLAKDMTARVILDAKSRPFYTDGFLRIGYAADPLAGGEEAALRCRRAGAWAFRTSKCDDETLKFCQRYGLKIILLPKGDQKACVDDLARIAKGPYTNVVAAVQLGDDPTGGADFAKWRVVAGAVRRQLPRAQVVLPARDAESGMLRQMAGSMANVTHLAVDLTDAAAPYARLDKLARQLRDAPDKQLGKLKLWAVAPGGWKGLKGAKELAWQMHWICSAFAVERTEGVLFAREYKPDDFGLLMRHFLATAQIHPYLMGHGEGTFVDEKAEKLARKPAVAIDEMDIGLSDSSETDVLDDPLATGRAPKACEAVAKGRPGDLEYLVLAQVPGCARRGISQICLATVNTTSESVELGLKIIDKGGAGDGFRRNLRPDPKTGAVVNLTTPRGPHMGKGFSEPLAPGEISFMDFTLL